MVRKVAENGTFYHEPPYTELEEIELYRQMAGIAEDGTCAGFTVLHRAPPAAAPAPQANSVAFPEPEKDDDGDRTNS